MYTIQIDTAPDTATGKHFWCVLRNDSGKIVNCAHGWGDTIEDSARLASSWFFKHC